MLEKHNSKTIEKLILSMLDKLEKSNGSPDTSELKHDFEKILSSIKSDQESADKQNNGVSNDIKPTKKLNRKYINQAILLFKLLTNSDDLE